jgi:hypothetical protein
MQRESLTHFSPGPIPQRRLKVIGRNRRRGDAVLCLDNPLVNDTHRRVHFAEQFLRRPPDADTDDPKNDHQNGAYDDPDDAQAEADYIEQ